MLDVGPLVSMAGISGRNGKEAVMHHMSAKFVVDNASRYPLERRQTDTISHKHEFIDTIDDLIPRLG